VKDCPVFVGLGVLKQAKRGHAGEVQRVFSYSSPAARAKAVDESGYCFAIISAVPTMTFPLLL
jgi:hypothetical protein